MMIGMILMFMVIVLPILAIGLLLGVAAILPQNRENNASRNAISIPFNPPAAHYISPATSPARYCSHCAAGLHSDWTHCPQCGAPV